MSLTNATYQRSIDLAGEIKQAKDVVTECDRKCEETAAAHESALLSLERAKQRLSEKIAERAELAAKAHADVMQAGEETPPAELAAGTWGEGILNGHARVADSELPEF